MGGADWTAPMQCPVASVPQSAHFTVPTHLCRAALQRQPLCKGHQDLRLLCLHVPRVPGLQAAAVAVLPEQAGLWAATGVGRGLAVPVQPGSHKLAVRRLQPSAQVLTRLSPVHQPTGTACSALGAHLTMNPAAPLRLACTCIEPHRVCHLPALCSIEAVAASAS